LSPGPEAAPFPLDIHLAGRRSAEIVDGRFDEPGSRRLVPTPGLVCDVDLLEANVARMAGWAADAGIALRPHVKTHKSAFVARMQLEHGAVGLSCAKVAEAEAVVDRLTADGWTESVSVLITSPSAGPTSAARVVALADRCDPIVVVDHPDGVDELVAAAPRDSQVDVLCDVDTGMGRSGVTGPDQARVIADRVARHPGLRFAGVQGYGGHLQHLRGRGDRQDATRKANERLGAVIEALEGDGHRVALRTGGGTGTSGIDMELGLLNEIQPGSYVFMDRQYRDALGGDLEGRFDHSLTIATTVVSANHSDFVTVDAGLKAMATDAGMPTVVGHDDIGYHFFGDEHGLVTLGATVRFRRGDRIELVPPHCDPTVDRYDLVWLVRGDTVVGAAAVDARGCSQ
jgi:D-serine deaminase-like pyridoxal phosphate-dependent protein